MTYCLGIMTHEGLILASDSRTNAGSDDVSVYPKMHKFVLPGERVFVLLCSGSLSLSQSVITLLGRDFKQELVWQRPRRCTMRRASSASRSRQCRPWTGPRWNATAIATTSTSSSAARFVASRMACTDLSAGQSAFGCGGIALLANRRMQVWPADSRPRRPLCQHFARRSYQIRLNLARFDDAIQCHGWAAHRSGSLHCRRVSRSRAIAGWERTTRICVPFACSGSNPCAGR